MTAPIRIPTQAQIEALAAGFQRLGCLVDEVGYRMADAFAAGARQLELERWERAEARREAQWHRQQEKAILRQQLDRATSYFGRKRRWRRARGRRIEARRNPPYIGGKVWLARQTFARVRAGGAPLPKVMMLDEVDSFDLLGFTEEQARAEIAIERERAHWSNPLMGDPLEEQADV